MKKGSSMRDLSVIIPARNEVFLARTIDNLLENKKANTEIIAVLDGYWPDPPIKDHPDVNILHYSVPIGQRAAVNAGARASAAKYVMKLDAHCAVDDGFDVKLMAHCEPDWTVIPRMYNLHAFDMVCDGCGHAVYQGPTPEKCEKCGGPGPFHKNIIWKPRFSRRTDFMRFDAGMKFAYWPEYEKRPEAQGDVVPLLSSIGACFFMERERFWEIGGLDEAHGSWGQFGTEIACKSWLSGGQHMVNKTTWFSHMFRTQKDFSFPYEIRFQDQEAAREYSRDLWLNNKWAGARYPLSWLIQKFAPVPEFDDNGKAVPAVERKTVKRTRRHRPLLSVLIPARNERYLQNTIDDLHKNLATDYEIIVGLDDYDPDPPLAQHERVRVHRAKKRIGMRPMINVLAGLARGKYLMKTDAHCCFDQGYDQKLIDICGPGKTVLGIRYELDVEAWQRKERTNCDFRYLSNPDVDEMGGLRGLPWHEFKKGTKGEKVSESMSLSGSGWLMEKAQWDAWGGLDENHGTFGQEGAEIACKTWLSGGQLLINRETWYAHWNRGKAPYALSRKQRDRSVAYSIDYWMNNRWPLQKYAFNWLIDKFNPPGWPENISGDPLPAQKQVSLYKGFQVDYKKKYRGLSVDNLWEKRIAIAEPGKRWRIALMYESFMEVVEKLRGGHVFTDDEIRRSRYYHYLLTHTVRFKVIPQTINKFKARWDGYVIRKFKSGIRLFESIRNDGLKAPLEFYREDGAMLLWKGYRRLVILKALGVKEAGVVTHLDKTCKKLPPLFAPVKTGRVSIDDLAQAQFAQFGGRATDKYWTHRYTPIYDQVLGGLRDKKIKILEIGLARGASLALWHAAFPKAEIFGIDKDADVWREMAGDLDRIKTFVGKQEDINFLIGEVIPEGPFDVIIDDCGHKPENQMVSFTALWPALKSHGWYILEDCFRNFLSKNKDGVSVPDVFSKFVPEIYDNQRILSLLFRYNLCLVQKGIEP
jgi:glycosyltransferase involved in cell wall biosynthesis